MNTPAPRRAQRDPLAARPPRRARWTLLVAVGVVALALVGAGIFALSAADPSTGASPKDMAGHPVDVDPTFPSAAEVRRMDVIDRHERLRVDRIGLDVPLGSMSTVGDVVSPPDFVSAYVVRDLGVDLEDASTGTVYVAMHALRYGGLAPGNYIQDGESGASLLRTGDVVTVGSREYRITGAESLPQTELGSTPIWDDEPGRLIMITCVQYGGVRTGRNLVVTGTLLG